MFLYSVHAFILFGLTLNLVIFQHLLYNGTCQGDNLWMCWHKMINGGDNHGAEDDHTYTRCFYL